MITWNQVLDLAPELSTVPPGTRAFILEAVALQVNETAWGDRYDLGCTLLAAHMGTNSLRGGSTPSGAVQSESVGDVSVTYAAGSTSTTASGTSTTTYGTDYARLVRLLVGRIGMVA